MPLGPEVPQYRNELTNMNLDRRISQEIQESIQTKEALASQTCGRIAEAASLILSRIRAGNKLILFGNGGSASDAQHIAAEFVGRYRAERRALPAIALTANSSTVTAIGNDYGFDDLFARQIPAFARPGDVAIAISTSGNSANVVRGVEAAKRLGVLTVALTGASGGKLRELADICLSVPSESTPRIQEAHILIGHILSGIVEDAILSENNSSASVSLNSVV